MQTKGRISLNMHSRTLGEGWMNACIFGAAVIEGQKHNEDINITRVNPSAKHGPVGTSCCSCHLSGFKLLFSCHSVLSSLASHKYSLSGFQNLVFMSTEYSLRLWKKVILSSQGISVPKGPNILFVQCSLVYPSCPNGTLHCRLLLYKLTSA